VNHLRALDDNRGRPRLYVDIAHPINQKCRTSMEDAVIQAYRDEQVRAQEPGYVAPDLDDVIEFLAPRNGARRASTGSGQRAAQNGSAAE